MLWNENYYDQLILKIDLFTRKFYINQLIRGALYFTGLLTVVFLAYNLLENQFYFSKSVRTVLSFSYIGLFGFSLWYWIASPLLHYFQLGKLISHEEAAKIIGTHFTDVEDKLLNVLQLKSQSLNYSDRSLIEASIQQKSIALNPIPFVQAIDLQKNRKYIQYAIAPLLILFSLLVWAPGMIQKPTQRLIQINKDFEKEAPFHFKLETEELNVEQNGTYELKIKIDGNTTPAEAYIDVEHFQYRLKKVSADEFSYTFSNVQKDLPFKLFAGSIVSPEYTLKVIMRPAINSFRIHLEYPAYINKKNEVLENIGDLIVPIGTKIRWNFNMAYTDHLYIKTSEDKAQSEISRQAEHEFQFSKKALKDQSYTLYLKNNQLKHADSVNYQINIIPDQHPQIQVEQFEDSTDWQVRYYSGELSDDYGIRNLSFNFVIKKKDGTETPLQTKSIITLGNKSNGTFNYVFDAAQFLLEPGDAINYYFEVWDNDGVNGSKSSRSQFLEYKEASDEELAQKEEINNEAIKENLEDAVKQSKKLLEKLGDYKDKLRQKKSLDWQTKKDLEKMTEQQKKLQEQFEEAKKKLEENLKKQRNTDENLQEKQEQLQKLFNETGNNEMKKLMEQIQNLMNELNKDQAIQMSEQFENQNTDLSKEMDRLLQLFKQLEVEKNLKDQINDLNKLAEQQDQLSEKTEKKSEDQEALKNKQDSINKKFDELAKKQEDIKKKNEELKDPRKMEDRQEQSKDVKNDLKDSKNELDKSNNSGASKKQKKASDKMKEMSKQMEAEMQESDEEQAEEDAKMLRQLLENLVGLSFDQEKVTNEMATLNPQTPHYLTLLQDQFKIKDNFKIVQDTLEVLSQRIVDIQSFVMEKISEINENFKKGIDLLEERKSGEASNNQRRVMKNLNDLAVMLSESLDDKQKECNSSCDKPGKKACKKPGNKSGKGKKGKVPSDKITESQKGMQKGMQEQMQKMQNGKQGTAQEFGELAAKQAKLKKLLQEQEDERKQGGNGSKQAQEILDEMEKMEKQLVNKQLTHDMVRRQQEITTRLLEAERADRERDWDEKRKSETGTNIERKLPAALEDYIKQRQAETEWFKQVSPDLKPFYKKLVEQYYQSLKKQG